MKALRCVIGGVIFGVISIFVAWLIYNVLFLHWASQADHLWRPQDSWQVMLLMPLNHVFSGILVTLGFAILYKGIPWQGIRKGIMFGLILSLVVWLPSEIFWYTTSPIPFMLAVAGWLHRFFASILGGIAIAAVYGKSLDPSNGVFK